MEAEFVKLTPDQEKARNRRNLVIALSIAGFVLLVFLVTMAKLQTSSLDGTP